MRFIYHQAQQALSFFRKANIPTVGIFTSWAVAAAGVPVNSVKRGKIEKYSNQTR